MAEKYKIGVFGGSFDPVHAGHIDLAEFILDNKHVNKIIFLPSACPPHKQKAAASFVHRLKMLEIAVRDYPDLEVSSVEAQLSHPSYTINSLRVLVRSQPQADWFFILGADSLLDLGNWYQYTEILDLVNLLVVARPGISDKECLQEIDVLLGNFVVSQAQKRFWTREDSRKSLLYLDDFIRSFSSTEIRSCLALGMSPPGLLPEVFSYIKQHGLYGVQVAVYES